MLIHSKHNLCQLCCCPDTGCKDMKKNVFDKFTPPITLHIYILLKFCKLLKAVYPENGVIEYPNGL